MRVTSFICRFFFLLFIILTGLESGNSAYAANVPQSPASVQNTQPVSKYAQPKYFYATIEKIEKINDSAAPQSGENGGSDMVTLKLTSGPDSGKEITTVHENVNIPEVVNMNLNP